MDEFIKFLDKNLEYISHTIIDDICYISVASNREEVKCPFCGHTTTRIHSTYIRTFQDLPIQGKKVIIKLHNRKMFCINPECKHITFAERFDFLSHKAKKSKRLEEEIVRLSSNYSSTAASEILKKCIADVGKSTVCTLLKKNRDNY